VQEKGSGGSVAEALGVLCLSDRWWGKGLGLPIFPTRWFPCGLGTSLRTRNSPGETTTTPRFGRGRSR